MIWSPPELAPPPRSLTLEEQLDVLTRRLEAAQQWTARIAEEAGEDAELAVSAIAVCGHLHNAVRVMTALRDQRGAK